MKPTHSLFVSLILCSLGSPEPQCQGQTIYDEDKVPEYTLPALLKTESGKSVRSATEWEQQRRPEIFQAFEKEVYGQTPSDPPYVNYRVTSEDPHAFGGKATQTEITLFFGPDRDGPTMSLLLFTPNGKPHATPAFLGLNFNGNHTVHASPEIAITSSWVRNNERAGIRNHQAQASGRGSAAGRWSIERILDRGYALATAYYGDIDPDFDDGFQNGVHALYHEPGTRPEAHEWGSIAAWAWGLSRALDYLERDARVDADKVALLGHSRLGKTALWAGARDPRFALVISNNSGCGGAALSRREFGETVARINQSFPHWFCDNFVPYGKHVAGLPVDQHQLIALQAPRPVYVASATVDRWADPQGEFLAAYHASSVYELYGMEGITNANRPAPDTPVGDAVRYHLRTGKHDVTDYDWQQYLNFADRHFR